MPSAIKLNLDFLAMISSRIAIIKNDQRAEFERQLAFHRLSSHTIPREIIASGKRDGICFFSMTHHVGSYISVFKKDFVTVFRNYF